METEDEIVEILYLSRSAVESLGMTMAEVLAAVENGFRLKGLGKTEMPPKPGIHPRPDCFIHAMPAYVREVEAAGLKWVSGYPPNMAKGLPYITGLLDPERPGDGHPDRGDGLRVDHGDADRRERRHLGQVPGAGRQRRRRDHRLRRAGAHQPHGAGRDAAEAARGRAATTCIPAATEAFIREMSARFGRLKFTPCRTPAEMARDADVIVTAIPIVTKPQPPLDAGLLKSGGLAVSLDYDSAWTSAAMKQCDKFVTDDIGQLLSTREHGVYFGGIPEKIYADLGELAAGLKKGRESATERIFSMNMGIAVDDMVTAKALYRKALERKAGVRLPLVETSDGRWTIDDGRWRMPSSSSIVLFWLRTKGEPMKVVAFNGSPRKDGNTACLINHVFERAADGGHRDGDWCSLAGT